MVGGSLIVDTIRARYVWEHPFAPFFYVPTEDLLRPAPGAGEPGGIEIEGYTRIPWDTVDQWFEEDEQIFGHPRDPYHRCDVRDSSRHIRVLIDGEVVAESIRPKLLFETNLPTRYYLPRLDVRNDLLVATTTSSYCPYKGTASYWSVRVGDRVHADLVWGYHEPMLEMTKIAGLVCFYNEEVDIEVDGVRKARPAKIT